MRDVRDLRKVEFKILGEGKGFKEGKHSPSLGKCTLARVCVKIMEFKDGFECVIWIGEGV